MHELHADAMLLVCVGCTFLAPKAGKLTPNQYTVCDVQTRVPVVILEGVIA
jgi:hypothetical protein